MEGSDITVSKTIDSRVVEMKFNNKQFESGVKQSLSTLERLKNALKSIGSNKSLDGLGKSTKKLSGLDSIASSLSNLEKRFSALGIVGMRVIQNLTDGLMGGLGKAINFVKEGIVSGGIRRASNIENAHFQLQGLLKDEKLVQAVMDDAMKSVDGTAYAYDEAAKAASMFAASGIEAGDEMLGALRGIVGTAAVTNQEFERVSMIFTAVSGQGRLMGDQLLQLSSMGLNAPATIAKFFNGVNDGSKKASDAVTKAVKEISNGKELAEADIRELVSDGQISFKIFAEAMEEAFADQAEKANETFTGSLANIKSALARIGAGFVSPLIEQNSKVVKLFNAVREKVNEVKAALVFDKSIGNINALSKRFTDNVLDMAKALTKFVKQLDVAKGMKVFYNVFDSFVNIFKGFGSILAPIGKAFADVFLGFNVKDVIKITKEMKKLTSGFKLSEEASKNLHDAFEGIFNLAKLGAEVFFRLLGAILPINGPVVSLTGGFLGLIGALGRGLTAFTSWVRETKLVDAAFNALGTGVKFVFGGIGSLVNVIVSLVKKLHELGVAKAFIDAVVASFMLLGDIAAPYVDVIIKKVEDFADKIKSMMPKDGDGIFSAITAALKDFKDNISNIDLGDPIKALKEFGTEVKKMFDNLTGGKQFTTIGENVVNFAKKLRDAFDFKEIVSNIETFQHFIQNFVSWFGNTIGNLFDNVSLGGVAATAGGGGLIYAIVQLSKNFEKATGSLKSIPKVLTGVSGALENYQKKLKAEALKETAKAIIIVAGAIAILSLIEPERALAAATALSMVSGTLAIGLGKLMEAINKGATAESALTKLAKGLGKGFNNFAKAVKWKAIGSAFKDMGTSIALIAGSIVALALMYRKDPQAMADAEELVAKIAIAMTGILAAMTLLSKKMSGASTNISKIGLGLLAISASITLVVSSLKKLFKMNLPTDYQKKLGILKSLLAALGLLAIAMTGASKLAGTGKVDAKPIIALAASLVLVVAALKRLFKMDLPLDYKKKLGILAGIFVGMETLIISLGVIAKLSGGTVKMGGTILSMCVMIGTIVAALGVLSAIPTGGLLKGALALNSVLLTLATTLKATAGIVDEKASKTVLSMAAVVGSISISLGVLSMIPIGNLATASASLGAMLYAMALNFRAISQIVNEKAWETVAAMVVVMISIAASLVILASQPWKNMAAAGAAMTGAMTAFALAFSVVSNARDINLSKISLFLAATTAVIPIGVALYTLSKQPWKGMLAAGAAITSVVGAFGVAFALISKSSGINLGKIGLFLSATLAVIPIGIALEKLSKQPWKGMLAAGTAISEVIVSMSAAMLLCTKAGNTAPAAIKGVGLLDIFIANFALVLTALGKIFEGKAAKNLLGNGSSVLAQIGYAIGDFVGSIVGGALGGISSGLPAIGKNLTAFVDAAGGFFEGVKNIDAASMKGVKYMAQAILTITAADILSGLMSWLTGGSSLTKFGKELAEFGPYLAQYSNAISGVNSGAVKKSSQAVSILSDMASGLPNTGGLAAKIFGDNKLSDFGKELTKFGPYLAQYSNAISGMNSSAVKKSAEAAEVMAQFAQKLPNSGGLAAKILGDNKLSAFGKELAKFGPYLTQYSNSVNGVKPTVVTATANAAKVLTELATNVPKSGGILSFFTGKQDMSAFGKSLASFGEGILGYYQKVAGIIPSKLTSSISGIKELIALIKGMNGITESSTAGFVAAIKKLGETGVDSFANAFINSKGKVQNAVQTMVSAASSGIQNKNGELTAKGVASANAYITGLRSKSQDAKGLGVVLANWFVVGIQSKNSAVQEKGGTTANYWIKGLRAKSQSANSAAKQLVTSAIAGFTSKNTQFTTTGTTAGKNYISGLKKGLTSGLSSLTSAMVNIGKNISQGIAKGLNANSSIAINAAKQLASKLDKQVRSELDIHSPSKKGEDVGKRYDEGVGKGLSENIPIITKSAKKASKSISDSFEDALVDSSNIVSKYAKGLSGVAANVITNFEEIEKYSKKASRAINQSLEESINANNALAQKNVKNLGTVYNSGIGNAIKNNANMVGGVAGSIISSFENIQKAAKETGKKTTEEVKVSLTKGIEMSKEHAEGLGKIFNSSVAESLIKSTSAIGGITSKIAKKLGDSYKYMAEGENAGGAFNDGFNKGISEGNFKPISKMLNKVRLTIDDSLNGTVVGKNFVKNFTKDFSMGMEQNIASMGNKVSWFGRIMNNSINEEFGRVLHSSIKEAARGIEEEQGRITDSEREFWKKLLKAKREGADAEKYQDMTIMEFRKETLTQIKGVLDEYDTQVKELQDSLMSQMNTFAIAEKEAAETEEESSKKKKKASKNNKESSKENKETAEEKKKTAETNKKTAETEKKNAKTEEKAAEIKEKAAKSEKKSAKEKKKAVETKEKAVKKENALITSLQDQVKQYEKYQRTMKSLEKKLADTSLWEEVKDMGVDSLDTLKMLNKMTDSELTQYVNLYDKKLDLAGSIARSKLKDVKNQTDKEIKDIYTLQDEGNKELEEVQKQKLTVEEHYWNKLLEVKKAGADAEKYQETSIAEFRKTSLEDAVKALEDYQSKFESTRDSLMSQMDLFSELEEKETKSKDELIKILDDQIKAYTSFAEIYESLSKRLNGRNLWEALKDLGVTSVDQLKVINDMTDDELNRYADKYDQKLTEAQVISTKKLESLTTETREKLKDLFGVVTDVDLDALLVQFDGSIESVEQYIQNLEGPLKKAHPAVEAGVTQILNELHDNMEKGLEWAAIDIGSASDNVMQAMVDGLTKNEDVDVKGTAEKVINNVLTPMKEGKTKFKETGTTHAKNYNKGIKEKESEAESTGKSLANKAVTGTSKKKKEYKEQGTAGANNYLSGVKSKYTDAETTGQTLATHIINGIKAKASEFKSIGKTLADNIISGLQSKTTELQSVSTDIYEALRKGVMSKKDDYFLVGVRFVEGYIEGIESKIDDAKKAAKKLADETVKQTEKSLDINSPSRRMFKIANFAGLGFLNGLTNQMSAIAKASQKLGDTTSDELEDSLSHLNPILTDDIISQPVIRPTVDLSNVDKAASDISKLFNQAVALSVAKAGGIDQVVERQKRPAKTEDSKDEKVKEETKVVNNNFTQNNYSPKPLSRSDIYRQTNNQFALFRMAVSNS